MINIIANRKYSYILSGILVTASIFSLSIWGLKLGIDFTGGSLVQFSFAGERPVLDELQQAIDSAGLGGSTIQPSSDEKYILRLKDLSEDEHQALLLSITDKYPDAIEERFETVGPILGAELAKKAFWALGVALIGIIIFIAWAFRKVSRPVASWKYGASAVIALAHDTIITLGVFAVLGKFYNVEIDSLFVPAILTVIGFSVHDTIVVFDRSRENLFRGLAMDFASIVNKSVNDTIARSINTSLTTLLVLIVLFFFGGDTIHYFSLALIVGISVGTYSSIFVASPILVDWASNKK